MQRKGHARSAAGKVFYRPPVDDLHPFNLGLKKIAEGWGGRFAVTPAQEREVIKNLPNLDPAIIKQRRLDESQRLAAWCKKHKIVLPT